MPAWAIHGLSLLFISSSARSQIEGKPATGQDEEGKVELNQLI